MQTNLDYFKTLTVAQLKSILADFKATGYSKSRKSELALAVAVLMDGVHLDALSYAATLAPAKVSTRKGYNERMVNRLFGYHTQNGYGHMLTVVSSVSYDSPSMMALLTPAQRRRYRKQYNKQYGRLVAQVTNTHPFVGHVSN